MLLLHPEVATRDCRLCQRYLFDEESGEMATFRGEPVQRPPGALPNCQNGKGCPKGTPEALLSLSPRNRQAHIHYRQCRATGQFPDDPLVKEHARLIRDVEDHVEHLRLLKLITSSRVE